MTNKNRTQPGFRLFACCMVLGTALVILGCQETHRKNLIPNPSFEDLQGDSPAGWRKIRWRREARFAVASTGHTGSSSVEVASAEGGDASWTTDVPVRPYSRYRLSGWIKTENVEAGRGKGALLNLHNIPPLQTPALTGTQDWTPVSLDFDTGGNDAVRINCLLGGWGRSSGRAWFDDIRLEMLSTRALNPDVTIDMEKTGHPISEYIYGQFIEHLGRCIYGGIWSEMLEDRKFFTPVGAEESPWQIIGAEGLLSMSSRQPYVGAHSPEIEVRGRPGGIGQNNLAVIQGKAYEGRIILAGDAQAGPVLISLITGDKTAERDTVIIDSLNPEFTTYPLSFTAGNSTKKARLEITGSGQGKWRIGTVSLMPADNIEGFRPEVLALLRQLNAPVYRWPGGNFVSGYDWRDGIGERDRRPPRKNPAWKGIEHNDVGIHEFMDFCRLVGAEPYIAVNSGLGNTASAADEVEYVNGSVSSPMGRLRKSNGHPQPWKCRWWSIGNEMYGSWQLGHMPLEDYVRKHNDFAEAMRAKDREIRLIGVGSVGKWSETMLKECSEQMDLISEHFYCQESPGIMGHVRQIPEHIRRIADAHRTYRRDIPEIQSRDIRIALDEWNYWYGPHVYGELGTRYFLKDALGIAAGIHEYSRQSDIIFMANYAQTVNVIGAIKTNKTEAQFAATGMVLKLFRRYFGKIPVEVKGSPEPLDVAAALTEKKNELVLSVVNPTGIPQSLSLEIKGLPVPESAPCWRIDGPDPMAYNEPGKDPAVFIREIPSVPFSGKLTLPPFSVSLYKLRVPGESKPGSKETP